MKTIKKEHIGSWLNKLEAIYKVFAPLALARGNRAIGPLSQGELELGGQLMLSPVRVFFPESEPVVKFENGQSKGMVHKFCKPAFVFGCSAGDTKSIKFVDRFFETDFIDPNYKARREGALIAAYTGFVSGDNFEAVATQGYDVQFVVLKDGSCLVKPGSDAGAALIEELEDAPPDAEARWKALEDKTRAIPKEADLDKAAELLKAGKVTREFWVEIGNRCISCGGCTYICPTCTCFDMYDKGDLDKCYRMRCRDSCLMSGFTREASRHNPRGDDGKRAQRRIEHKLLYDVKRWQEIGCVACGRCDDTCPTGIGLYNVVKEMIRTCG